MGEINKEYVRQIWHEMVADFAAEIECKGMRIFEGCDLSCDARDELEAIEAQALTSVLLTGVATVNQDAMNLRDEMLQFIEDGVTQRLSEDASKALVEIKKEGLAK